MARKLLGRKAVPATPRPENRWEQMLAEQIAYAGLPEPKRCYHFDKDSKRHVDFAFVHQHVEPCVACGCKRTRSIAIEVDGSCHRIKDKWERDVAKHIWLVLHGWYFLRVTPAMVRDGRALAVIREALK